MLCAKYPEKSLNWLAAMKILHKIPSIEAVRSMAKRINPLELYRLKIHMKYMQPMISI